MGHFYTKIYQHMFSTNKSFLEIYMHIFLNLTLLKRKTSLPISVCFKDMKHGLHKICLQKWNLAYTKSCLQKWNLAYTKSFCCVWDPLTIALNSTPSKSKSSGAHHSIMFPTNQNRMIYNHDNKIMMNPSSYMNEDKLTYWENNYNMYCRSLLWI